MRGSLSEERLYNKRSYHGPRSCERGYGMPALFRRSVALQVLQQVAHLLGVELVELTLGHERDGRALELIDLFARKHDPLILRVEQRDAVGRTFCEQADQHAAIGRLHRVREVLLA